MHKLLRFYARQILKKYKPAVIGVTGSVGKSATKEAIYIVLKRFYRVRRSLKNYNNEIGAPLTILGRLSPGKKLSGWLRVFWMALGSLWFTEKSYPEILVLEMDADHPGDIKYLTDLAPCRIGVITAIGPSHLEFFKNIDSVIKEKQIIVTQLPPGGWAVLNVDDENILRIKEKADSKIITFGLSEEASVRALEINLDQELTADGSIKVNGLRFKFKHEGSVVPVFLPDTVSLSAIYAALAAAAVGVTFGLNLVEISDALKAFVPLAGRMKLIPGLNHTLIIDDTYNSSPKAAISALDSLDKIHLQPGARRWIVLADMLELGRTSIEEHENIGRAVVEHNFDYLLTFGLEAKNIALGAKKMGHDKIFFFDSQDKLIEHLQQNIRVGDLILIKGSQGMRMERVVKALMAEPQKAKFLLVRQSNEWDE
ncbi:MAG: UDP-N-acetylmuramoyl-tripeptide--D-alanyl-D-alanine ligase [Candidatus Parcubacteria bacterium]|nr:UDP-N-acetylmuramoyl-tripeptide--D-alanyl-D-alanine ligase [Candidatus Parcubacteria bacterium]